MTQLIKLLFSMFSRRGTWLAAILSCCITFIYFLKSFPDFFSNFSSKILSVSYGVIEGSIHTGDLLQLQYLSWMTKMNLIEGQSLFLDRFTFQMPGVAGYPILEIGPLYILTAITSIWTSQEFAWNLCYILLPMMLGTIFNFLLFNIVLKNKIIAIFAAVVPLFVFEQLQAHLFGHQSGAYYFFIPLTLYFLEHIYRSKGTSICGNIGLFIALFLGLLGELHIGYYSAMCGGIWLLVHFIADIELKNLLKITLSYIKNYFGFLLAMIASVLYGLLLQTVQFESKDVSRNFDEYKRYSAELYEVLPTFNDKFAFVTAAVIIFAIIFTIVSRIQLKRGRNISNKSLEQSAVFSKSDWVSVATYLTLTIIFLALSCGGRKPVSSGFPLVNLFHQYVPFFSMQRVLAKMLPIAYLTGLLLLLIPWKLFINRIKSIPIQYLLSFIVVGVAAHLQVTSFASRIPTYYYHYIEKTPYEKVYNAIRTNTTRQDIIVDLPLLGGQDGFDGKAFDIAMRTERRVVGGYNGAVPSYYAKVLETGSLFYGPTLRKGVKALKELNLRYVFIDKMAPDIQPSVVKTILTSGVFQLIYEDQFGAFLKVKDDFDSYHDDQFKLPPEVSYEFSKGFGSVERTSRHLGCWITEKESEIVLYGLKPQKAYNLKMSAISLIPNTSIIKHIDIYKEIPIQYGVNVLDFDFVATSSSDTITIKLDKLIEAKEFNPTDTRKIGLFVYDVLFN